MKIGIILHPYGEDKPAGLARTIFELTKGMLRSDSVNEYIIFLKHKSKTPPELPGANWRIETLGGGYFWLDRLKKATPADVYIFNTPVLPLRHKPKKSIVLALDFAYEYFPSRNLRDKMQKVFTRWYHAHSLKNASAIIAISEATKKDVIRFFNIPERKIKVIYCGFKKICDLPEKAVNLPEKFFLFIGVIKERKNVFNIVKAFNEFRKYSDGYKLAIAGNAAGKYYETIRDYVRKKGIENDVLFVGHLNDNEVSYIYRKANSLVFPSLVEGFGYPVLEAMDCGLPVITSNISSLVELGGNGSALLVNPYSVTEIKDAMNKIVSDSEVREEVVRNGFLQAQRFSWDKSAKEMLKIIETLTHPMC